MIAFYAYCWWKHYRNLIDFLPTNPCEFYKDEHTHQWTFEDGSVLQIECGIPYLINEECDSLRMEP